MEIKGLKYTTDYVNAFSSHKSEKKQQIWKARCGPAVLRRDVGRLTAGLEQKDEAVSLDVEKQSKAGLVMGGY